MSKLWDQVTVVHNTGTNVISELNDSLVDPPLQATLPPEETPMYVVVGTDDGLVRKTDEWQTSEVPGSSPGTCCLVTDRRSIFIIGNCPDPEISGDYVQDISHAAVDTVTAKNSLLTTRFSIRSNDGVRFRITPTEFGGLEEAATYIRRAQAQWVRAEEFFIDFEQQQDRLTEAVANSEIDRARRERAKMLDSLSELGQSSSLYNIELPVLDQKRAEAKQRIVNAMCHGHWQRICDILETGDNQFEQGEMVGASEAYRDGCELYQSMVETGGPDFSLPDIESANPEFQPVTVHNALIDRLEESSQALSDRSLGTQREGLIPLTTGIDYIDDGLQVIGNSPDISQQTISVRLTELRQQITSQLEECVKGFEERGDEAAESGDKEIAAQQYERGIDALDCQQNLVTTDDALEYTLSLGERRKILEEKIGRLEWQWGGGH